MLRQGTTERECVCRGILYLEGIDALESDGDGGLSTTRDLSNMVELFDATLSLNQHARVSLKEQLDIGHLSVAEITENLSSRCFGKARKLMRKRHLTAKSALKMLGGRMGQLEERLAKERRHRLCLDKMLRQTTHSHDTIQREKEEEK